MSAMSGHSFHEVDVALALQAHIGLLEALAPADEAPVALLLALDVDDVHGRDLDLLLLEEQLDRGLDLGLGRVGHDFEDDLAVRLADEGGLLRDHRGDDDLHQAFLVHARASSRCLTAARVTRTFSKRIRLTGSASRASSTRTLGRLRAERNRFSSTLSVRISTSLRPRSRNFPARILVLGWSTEKPSITDRRSSRTSCERMAAMPARYILRLSLCVKFSSGLLGKIRPPPRHKGLEVIPARARPVPFWRQGLRVEWRTSLRVFCLRDPCRPLAV